MMKKMNVKNKNSFFKMFAALLLSGVIVFAGFPMKVDARGHYDTNIGWNYTKEVFNKWSAKEDRTNFEYKLGVFLEGEHRIPITDYYSNEIESIIAAVVPIQEAADPDLPDPPPIVIPTRLDILTGISCADALANGFVVSTAVQVDAGHVFDKRIPDSPAFKSLHDNITYCHQYFIASNKPASEETPGSSSHAQTGDSTSTSLVIAAVLILLGGILLITNRKGKQDKD